MGRAAGLTALAWLLVVGGCAAADDARTVPADGGSPDASASPEPTAACPVVPDQPVPEGCAPYDGEASMRLNDAHERERDPHPEALAAAQEAQPRAEAALATLLATDEPLTVPRAFAVLEAAGFDRDDIQASQGGPWNEPDPDVLGVGISFEGACLRASVRRGGTEGTGVSIETGGTYLEGPCLLPTSH